MKLSLIIFVILLNLSLLMVSAKEVGTNTKTELKIQEGIASYYGRRFHMRKTANGEIFNMNEMTAAHKNLPFGTKLKVTNTRTGKEVWVRINDRLPQNSKRIIDLSRGAAKKLDMIQDGIVPVTLEATDDETIFSLIDHYLEDVPEDIRLRVYADPIDYVKPDFCPAEIVLEPQGGVMASI